MKRIFDFAFALLGLIFLSPLFLLVAAVIKIDSRGPILFRQERMGRNFVPFTILKFRSMRTDNAGSSVTSAIDTRITRIGRILRKSKIDELPQLINVAKGEMSLVGPRPELRKYVELFPESQKIILSVLPGITDPAAIMGIDEESVLAKARDIESAYINDILPQKHSLQIQYVAKQSLGYDLKIIFRTLFEVFLKILKR